MASASGVRIYVAKRFSWSRFTEAALQRPNSVFRQHPTGMSPVPAYHLPMIPNPEPGSHLKKSTNEDRGPLSNDTGLFG